MVFQSAKRIFDDLYSDIDGFQIAQDAFKKMNHYYIGYEYGEAAYHSFFRMLQIVKPLKKEVFYDLGSGTGSKVFIASLLFGMMKSVGLEIITDLYSCAQEIKRKYYNQMKLSKLRLPVGEIAFHNTDFNDYDFSDANIVYLSIAPLALEIELNGKLGNKLESLKVGSRLITSNIAFLSSRYKIEGRGKFEYANGNGMAYFHKKFR
jgi:hypothetical protein